MLEVFGALSLWFWILVAVEFVWLVAAVEKENGVSGTVSLFVFAGLLQWLGEVDIWGFVINNPLKIVAILVGYCGLGICWATFKWYLYVGKKAEEVNELREKFLIEKNIKGKTVPEELKKEWSEYFKNKNENRFNNLNRPLVKDHKSDFFRWMGFWWVSMFWSLVHDFVKGLFKAIYRKFSNFWQNIADKKWDEVTEDIDE